MITIKREISPASFCPYMCVYEDDALWFKFRVELFQDIKYRDCARTFGPKDRVFSDEEVENEFRTRYKNEFPDKQELVDEAFDIILKGYE